MKGKSKFTKEEAREIEQLIMEKLDADVSRQKAVRAKIRKLGFYASDFGIGGGYTVEDFRRVTAIVGKAVSGSIQREQKTVVSKQPKLNIPKRGHSDESYILDLCDEILKEKSLRQQRFDFLKGDTGARLPVDAYYPVLNLVIEYREKQHTETVGFWDKKPTASGIPRGEQRKKYDELRRVQIPANEIRYLEIDYSRFNHKSNKQLTRNSEADKNVLLKLLKNFLK